MMDIAIRMRHRAMRSEHDMELKTLLADGIREIERLREALREIADTGLMDYDTDYSDGFNDAQGDHRKIALKTLNND